MSFQSFANTISHVVANTITQELETANKLMDKMGGQNILISYQACIFILEHELCTGTRIQSLEEFKDFLAEYENSFVLTELPFDLAGIFALNKFVRKPILQALAQRTTEIFLTEGAS